MSHPFALKTREPVTMGYNMGKQLPIQSSQTVNWVEEFDGGHYQLHLIRSVSM